MSRELLITGISFGLFIVCPRMAGMMHVIGKHTSVSMFAAVFLGLIVSVPVLFLMVYALPKIGIWGALGICVVTDFGAALLMKDISVSAGIETLIIALFVIIGVKTAPILTKLVSNLF